MLRVASGDRAPNQGISSSAACRPWESCGSASRWSRSCGAMLACGTRIGIPRWLPDADAVGAGDAGTGGGDASGGDASGGDASGGDASGGDASGGDSAGPGPAAAASDGIVTGPVSHGAVGHSA